MSAYCWTRRRRPRTIPSFFHSLFILRKEILAPPSPRGRVNKNATGSSQCVIDNSQSSVASIRRHPYNVSVHGGILSSMYEKTTKMHIWSTCRQRKAREKILLGKRHREKRLAPRSAVETFFNPFRVIQVHIHKKSSPSLTNKGRNPALFSRGTGRQIQLVPRCLSSSVACGRRVPSSAAQNIHKKVQKITTHILLKNLATF
ncbi:hypothetical protein B0J15DRAFT_137400 [Fusarium solani]|jgi:hypothetical protein|uniref:Uncharacterized protein n=1 Tax=Fusarium solani TaxID=169388 RepID=A0A9P9L624_FUSSL|nr:uncharacterized protein B0J15DRAFT_137400 [Fusarium solani]KAH7274647.1 hypothetical protein B0J15DRAFT_137400 [Fusarium solani]